jgi:hypothetical protein
VPAGDAPLSVFARPHARVTKGASDGRAVDVDDEVGAQGDEGSSRGEAADAELERGVLADADGAGAVASSSGMSAGYQAVGRAR